jgi:hypothetical protein
VIDRFSAFVHINSKAEMYQLLLGGQFGNKLRMWPTYEAMLASGYSGLFSMRYKGGGGGLWCAYDVTHDKRAEILPRWVAQGADPALVMHTEGAPDDKIIVQGELRPLPDGHYFFPTILPSGPYFYCSFEKLKMRDALKASSQHLYGLRVLELLRHHMTSASFEDLQELREQYPDSVIELSVYSTCLGDIPRRNHLVWEIRNYAWFLILFIISCSL